MGAYPHADPDVGLDFPHRHGSRGWFFSPDRSLGSTSLFEFQIIRSRWHVPTQVLGTCLAIVGYILGHKHKGRQFEHTAHASFAPILGFTLFAQIVLGVYLRLHIERGFLGTIRRGLVFAHGFIGKAMPIMIWVQFVFGGIAALGFCRGDHLGQCLAHFIMGSAFIAYGIILTIALLVGQLWIKRTGRSQEFFDSCVIAAWGCVNTFTEHRWGGPWVKNDLQHTSMGIIWWCAGLVGIWLSRTRDGRPKRNVIPGIVIMLTGYAMSGHPQELHLSTMVHAFFGYTLMLAGLTRIIEISFVLKDRATLSPDGNDPNSFQYIPIFLLYASGFLFAGATEEQMALLSRANVTHVSYMLILYSIAFILFLFVNVLIHIYASQTFPPDSQKPGRAQGRRRNQKVENDEENASWPHTGSQANGSASRGTSILGPRSERQHLRDAQEFELDALISGDEEDSQEERDEKLRTRKNHERGGPREEGSESSGPSVREEGRVRL
ncbi:MAG: hypothetical protein Q9162_003733 [Coniocarpon cinnabarinum]